VAVDGQVIDYVRLRAQLADGLAVVDSSVVRLGTAEATLDGSFGLVAWRTGTLAYRIAIDSLHAFSPWVPLDIETSPPPVFVADNGWAGDYREPPPVDNPTGATEPPLGGRLLAEGTLHGNIERFDIDGRADVENFAFDGNYIGRGRADYDIRGFGTPSPHFTVSAGAREVQVGGVAFDSAVAWVRYEGERYGSGRAIFAAYQDADSEYHGDIEFALSLERSELQLADLTLRFDTVTWQLVQPATIAWGGEGVAVANLDIVSDAGGRVRVNGTLPIDGAGDFDFEIRALEVGQLADLLQRERDVSGTLDLEARVEGTQRAPRMAGAFQLRQATLDGEAVPDMEATFTYAERRLAVDGVLRDGFRELAVITASLPIDLALTSDVEQRLLPGEIAVDIRADELELAALPGITDLVEDVQGRVSGSIAVRGTFDDPIIEGDIDLDVAALRIVPLGVTFENVAGALSMEGSVLRVDSLVAESRGEIRIDGTVDFANLTTPVFALTVVAENARVIDNGTARFDIDADLRIEGPMGEIDITGDVFARRGVMYIPPLAEFGSGEVVNLDDPGTFRYMEGAFDADRERMFARSPLLQQLNVDIALRADRNVWVRSTEANVEIYTPEEVGPLNVQLSGADRSITLLGVLNTDRGEYEFMSRRFRLTRGAATFVGGTEINPLIQVAAEHEVRLPGREAFEIRVVLSGELRDLEITLESTSQPPISQTDLLSYIAFGRDAASLLFQQGSALTGQGAGTGELVGNVAALATQQLAAVALEAAVNELEAGAMRDLGVDVFRITPADIPAELFTGNFGDALLGTEIEAGRYVTDRLFVATHLRYALRPGLRLEYWSPGGYQWRASWMPRFLPLEPTLTERDLAVRSAIGAFLIREWRF
jgi:translocation and assembly module TamB